MSDDTATALLALTAQAKQLTDPGGLRALLAKGHPLYCQALEDVRTHTRDQAADWSDQQLTEHAAAEGLAAAPGASREEILVEWVRPVPHIGQVIAHTEGLSTALPLHAPRPLVRATSPRTPRRLRRSPATLPTTRLLTRENEELSLEY